MRRQQTDAETDRPPDSDPPDGTAGRCVAETIAASMSRDAETVAAENQALAFRRHRLRVDVRSLASEAVATLRELITGPDIPPAVRLKACRTILQAADALETEKPGPLSAQGVQAEMDHRRLIDALGGGGRATPGSPRVARRRPVRRDGGLHRAPGRGILKAGLGSPGSGRPPSGGPVSDSGEVGMMAIARTVNVRRPPQGAAYNCPTCNEGISGSEWRSPIHRFTT